MALERKSVEADARVCGSTLALALALAFYGRFVGGSGVRILVIAHVVSPGGGGGTKPRDSPPLSVSARPFRLTPPRTLPPRPKPASEVETITKKMDELKN